MGMFKSNNRFSADTIDKPLFKIILGVITGSLWAISAVLLFVDALVNDLSTITRGLTGVSMISPLISDHIGDLATSVYNQTIYVPNIIALSISLLGIAAVVLIGLSLRTKSTSKIWKFVFLAALVEIFLFSLGTSIVKFLMIGGTSGVLALIAAVLSLAAGIMYFTVLPLDDIKAGIILVSAPLAYLGGTIVTVLLLLFLVSVLYSVILGDPIFAN